MFKNCEITDQENSSENERQIQEKTRDAVRCLQTCNNEYADVEELREIILRELKGKKFMLDCGHRVTFGHFLGNNIFIQNGKKPRIICSDCGY
jgi:hypothetical protein